MDLKVVPRSNKYILYVIDEVTNYLITVPIHQSKSEEYIMDQDSTCMSSLMNYLFKILDIKIKIVVPYNPSIITGRTKN